MSSIVKSTACFICVILSVKESTSWHVCKAFVLGCITGSKEATNFCNKHLDMASAVAGEYVTLRDAVMSKVVKSGDDN